MLHYRHMSITPSESMPILEKIEDIATLKKKVQMYNDLKVKLKSVKNFEDDEAHDNLEEIARVIKEIRDTLQDPEFTSNEPAMVLLYLTAHANYTGCLIEKLQKEKI